MIFHPRCAGRQVVLLPACVSLLLAACHTIPQTHQQAPPPQAATQGYSSPFDPWRACNKEHDDAVQGNPEAIHTCFLAAYVRQSDPFLGGEDLEDMFRVMGDILQSLGDDRFYKALSMERPEVRSAVGDFLSAGDLKKKYPKTFRLLKAAPDIDFPLSKSSRDEAKSPLLQKFIQFEKTGVGY